MNLNTIAIVTIRPQVVRLIIPEPPGADYIIGDVQTALRVLLIGHGGYYVNIDAATAKRAVLSDEVFINGQGAGFAEVEGINAIMSITESTDLNFAVPEINGADNIILNGDGTVDAMHQPTEVDAISSVIGDGIVLNGEVTTLVYLAAMNAVASVFRDEAVADGNVGALFQVLNINAVATFNTLPDGKAVKEQCPAKTNYVNHITSELRLDESRPPALGGLEGEGQVNVNVLIISPWPYINDVIRVSLINCLLDCQVPCILSGVVNTKDV